MASTMRSGSFHSKLPLFLPSMLRHSKRCLTQWNPPSRASCRSRAVVPELPHKKMWTAGSAVGIWPLAAATGDADDDAPTDAATAEGEVAGLAATVVAGGPDVGVGGAGVGAPQAAVPM